MIGSDILTLFPSSQTLLGKQVSELVGDDLKVKKDGSVVGTFHYVPDYTEFSSAPEEQRVLFPVSSDKNRKCNDVQKEWNANQTGHSF